MAGDYSPQELLFPELVGGFSSQELAEDYSFLVQDEVEEEKKERRNSVDPSNSFEILTNSNRLKPLSNFDIENILKSFTNFHGVYRKDMLPKQIGESVVITTQDYLDGGGTHWVCVVNQPDSNDAEYFDSFGVHPSDVVVDYMKTSGKGLVYSENHMQDVDSIMCSYYVCYFILERVKGRPMRDILLDFSKPKANEQMIEMFAVAHTGGGTKWKEQLADELHKPVRRKFR